MCLSEKTNQWIRSCDQLGVPVSLNLNQESVHRTYFGGCCSLIANVFLLLIFYTNMAQVVQLSYQSSAEYSYINISEEDQEAFTFTTDEVIPALQMYSMFHNNDTKPILDYVRPVILIQKNRKLESGFTTDHTHVAAVPCQEIYPEETYPTVYNQFKNQIANGMWASTEWFCFPPDTYQVLNNGWFYPESIMPSLTIHMCKDLGTDSLLPAFDNSNCVTDETEISEQMSQITIQAKIVSKYFSPTDYFESGEIGYRQANSFVGQFASDPTTASSIVQMNLIKQDITLWESSIINQASFPSIFTPKSLIMYSTSLHQ